MDLFDKALDFLFPPVCGICGKMNKNNLCVDCYDEYKSNIIIKKVKNNKYIYYDEFTYLFKYNGVIRQKILSYKFNQNSYLYKMFCEFFMKNEKIVRFIKNYDIIVPVPMHIKKVRIRGYNQSSLIAKQLAKNIENLQFYDDMLIKVKDNKVQSSLSRLQRMRNVKNVYNVQNIQTINNKNVLILDDIYTTGSTVNECAKVLKLAGINKVGVITIAKD